MITIHEHHAHTMRSDRQMESRRAKIRAGWSTSERQIRSHQATVALQALWSLISKNGVEGH